MLNQLLVAYDDTLSDDAKKKLNDSFVKADKFMIIISFLSFIGAAVFASIPYDTYLLGIVGGGVAFGISLLGYMIYRGTAISRILFAISFAIYPSLMTQQTMGMIEMHFAYFYLAAFLALYKDVIPFIPMAVVTAIHHLFFTYAQLNSIEFFGSQLYIFNHGCSWSLTFLHITLWVFEVLGLGYIVMKNTEEYIRTVDIISKGGENVLESASHIESASSNLAQSSNTQAASIEEISATIEEATSSMMVNSENARQANVLSEETSSSAQLGYEHMKKLTGSMQEINTSSAKISNIIKTIDEIAFQTNLLALNAAVEAARAGEHGLGFAVVAEEVRVLAGRSAEAAKETALIIEESISQVKIGNDIAEQTNQAFEEILGNIKKTGNLIGEIASASREQSSGMEQISSAVSQLDKVTQSISVNSEELAANSEELNKSANQMIKDLLFEDAANNSSYREHRPKSISKTKTELKPKSEIKSEKNSISVSKSVPKPIKKYEPSKSGKIEELGDDDLDFDSGFEECDFDKAPKQEMKKSTNFKSKFENISSSTMSSSPSKVLPLDEDDLKEF
jgi:hypothetical protein